MIADLIPYSSDPGVCLMLASHFEGLAAKLRAHAALREADNAARERRRQTVQTAQRAAAQVAQAVAKGAAPSDAIARLAERHGLNPDQIRVWWEKGAKRAGAGIRLRNVQIMRLAARGWTDAQIARKYKLSERQANRIVSRMLKQNPAGAAQAA